MYTSKLTLSQTQVGIKIIKDNFEKTLAKSLNLQRVSAPIIVESSQGINDDLGIKNSALEFFVNSLDKKVEIVQSLAKWKRIALMKYQYPKYRGIYTDMNAIRPMDIIDQTHSIYVDQWDWELVIDEVDRNKTFLREIVSKIALALKQTKDLINKKYPALTHQITDKVFFIDSEELDLMYPHHSSKEKERLITKKHKTVFIEDIGKIFKNGKKHDIRAADYDDWQLNGDILIWSPVLQDAIEISSMGIRVDKKALKSQMKSANRFADLDGYYYQLILKDKLPFTIGGGIGQSRICMILLEKYHIAEVQASIWRDADIKFFEENKITYL